MNYFKRASVWSKIKDTIQVIGTFTQLSLIFGDSQHIYNVIVAIVQLAGMIIPIWLEDKDHDDVIDIFQKEVVTTVTSDSPIKVETEVKKPDAN